VIADPVIVLVTAAVVFIPAALINLAVGRLGSRLNSPPTRLSWPWLAILVLLATLLFYVAWALIAAGVATMEAAG
jgi:protein-S-isoprenylcysteine O-methyltransferase Ste14